MRAVGVHHKDLPGRDGEAADERDPAAVGRARRRRVVEDARRQPPQPASVDADRVDVDVVAASPAREREPPAAEPDRAAVEPGVTGHASSGSPNCGHDVDLGAARAVALEREHPPVGRPRRNAVECRTGDDPPNVAPVRVHHVDVEAARAVAFEGDLAPVRRPLGESVQAAVPRQPALPRPVPVHHVELDVPVARRLEDDLPVATRKRGVGEPKRHARAQCRDEHGQPPRQRVSP